MTNVKTVFGIIVAALCILFGLQTVTALIPAFSYLLGDTYSTFGYEFYTYVSDSDKSTATFLAMVMSIAIWGALFVYAARIRDIITIRVRMFRNRFVARKLLK